ncbi:MAG: flagellar biosynthesis protein FliQ [Hyphomicrobium sp.]|nr:flagellar biosynthesis protein FliQ [Hyphomicrobium sp.]
MNEADAKELLQQAIWISLIVSAPVVIAVMAVGIVISVLQALTQIQEVTLTFVPKIVVALVMLVVASPFMGAQVGTFAEEVLRRIESVGR